MKNLSCNIISDLLPSYTEKKCSPYTKDVIKNHLAGCESCKVLLENMSVPLHTSPKKIPKTDIKKADKKVKLHYTKKTLIFACIAVLVILAISCIIPIFLHETDTSAFILIGAVFAFDMISMCVTMVVSFTKKYRFLLCTAIFILIGTLLYHNFDFMYLFWFIMPPLLGAAAGKIAKR